LQESGRDRGCCHWPLPVQAIETELQWIRKLPEIGIEGESVAFDMEDIIPVF
jgi:hypothetical protein